MKMTGLVADGGFATGHHIHAGHVVPRVWIVVADHAHAKLFRKNDHHFQDIGLMELKSHHHSKEHKKSDAEHFVREMGEWLSKAQKDGMFERIVMVAPSDLLSLCRDYFPANLQGAIAAEVSKDLMNLSNPDLEKSLQKIIVI